MKTVGNICMKLPLPVQEVLDPLNQDFHYLEFCFVHLSYALVWVFYSNEATQTEFLLLWWKKTVWE